MVKSGNPFFYFQPRSAAVQANADVQDIPGGPVGARQAWEGDANFDLRSMTTLYGRMPWRLASRDPLDIAVLLDPTRPIASALEDIQILEDGEYPQPPPPPSLALHFQIRKYF